MRTTTRLLLAAVAVTALVLPGSTAAVASRAAPRLDWAPCAEDPTAECAALSVPVDWSRPHGPKVDIALARRPATNPAARIGSLLINPGGPGGSGVDFALFGTGYFSPDLLARFDLVGFDPRGVARSHPVVCSLDVIAQAPPLVLTSQADFDRMAAYNRRLGRDCRAHTGPLFDHVDTISVVHDMDAIRAALGESKLTYYGISYGTLLGQQYAERFPNRIRALALDSNMDHSLGTAAFMDTETVTAEDSFDEFVAGCNRHAECVLNDTDIRALWADLLARAERGELRDPFDPTIVLTPSDLIFGIFGGFYGPDWFGIAEILHAVDTGVPPGGGAAFALWSRTRAAQPSRPAPELVENAFQAVFCQDWSLPLRDYRDFARHVRRQAQLAPDYRISPLALVGTVSCIGWPSPVNNPQHRLRVTGDRVLLLGNALHDPATGYNWATNAADQLGRHARLITYEGWGHGIYGRSACTTDAIDAYLISLANPARGTRCPAVEPGAPGPAGFVGPNRSGSTPPRWS
jgi:pimeloyl-ACP methyl ester carboxylesterase